MCGGVSLYGQSCTEVRDRTQQGEILSKHRVLIVEDHPDTRELLREQLGGEFDVMVATNGQEAILKVGERAPDVVIMDLMMPQLNGFETSRYMKLRYRERYLPIVVLSAKSDRDTREEGARYGCDDYRSKPYTKQQLTASINALLLVGTMENALSKLAEDDDEGRAKVRRELIDARHSLALRLMGEQSHGIARGHVERILELSPDHEGGRGLLAQLEAQA